jgi:hypothetical protein
MHGRLSQKDRKWNNKWFDSDDEDYKKYLNDEKDQAEDEEQD